MNDNGVLGIFKIGKGGLCFQYCEFEQAKKKLDPQLISGFFSALNIFTLNLFGEEIKAVKTDNYKILFKKDSEFLNVYVVENSFKDYDALNQDISCDFKDVLNSPANNI